MSFEPFIAAAVQMVSGSDVSENLAVAAGSIEEAASTSGRIAHGDGFVDSSP